MSTLSDKISAIPDSGYELVEKPTATSVSSIGNRGSHHQVRSPA
jgi:hypothetical protein